MRLAPLLFAIAQFGTIVFPNSGKPEAQEAFLQGVLLLHNFAYPQAARAFEEAERVDPNFALAYWGEAMTYNHPIWYETDADAGRKALAKFSGQVTPRERAYLDAVAKETMRLRPVIDAAERTLTKPRTVCGWELPPGV